MTPTQKLKWAILRLAAQFNKTALPAITEASIDAHYDELVARDEHWDAMNEFRSTGRLSGISRAVDHQASQSFEHEEVVAKMPDGSWVGWTYWFGGGKHADSSAVCWMDDAYEVAHRTETKIVDIFELPQ